MLRVDQIVTDAYFETHYYGVASVFALHPATEDAVRRMRFGADREAFPFVASDVENLATALGESGDPPEATSTARSPEPSASDQETHIETHLHVCECCGRHRVKCMCMSIPF